MARTTITIHIGRGEPPSVYWQDFIPADDAWMEGVFLPDRHGPGGGEHRRYTPQANRQALLMAGLPLVYAEHLLASPFAFSVSAEVANRAQADWLAAWVRYRDCTSDTPSGDPRLGLRLATVGLPGVGRRSAGVEFRHGVLVMPISLRFAPAYASRGGVALAEDAPEAGSLPALPRGLAPVCRELFAVAMQFNGVMRGPEAGNYRWTIDPNPQNFGAYFEAYDRRMVFFSPGNLVDYGTAHLMLDKIATLVLIWAFCPIPASITHRVDTKQKLNYTVESQGVVVGFHPWLELFHRESGEYRDYDMNPGGLASGTLRSMEFQTRDDWTAMSRNDWETIVHTGATQSYALQIPSPAAVGLPPGAVRARCLLMGDFYSTGNCQVLSNAIGGDGDRRMSKDALFLQFGPSWSSYTPGHTEGLMPPLEFELPTVLADGIEFDAVFDLKNLTTFRFVVKVTNNHDFAVGVVVNASGWQAWVSLQPGETKHLAGAMSISEMLKGNGYPVHPQSGWNGSWSSSYIAGGNGLCSIPFSLFLTAPTQPETTPDNLTAKKATQRWWWDLARFGPQNEPEWGAIKRYAADGRYDYEYKLFSYAQQADMLASVNRSITIPAYQALINAATYFVTGYNTSTDSNGPWHKRPWPTDSSWGGPIMASGEQLTWNGSQNVWVPTSEILLTLTRAMLQQVAATLGVTEYVVMDGDDIRWFEVVPVDRRWGAELWIDRFYTRGGAVIDAAAMRAAFQTVIANNAGSWSNYRNLTVHASVRFGSFLDNASFIGDYLLGLTGDMVEVSSLDDLDSVSTKFLYKIHPEFQ